MHNLEHQDVLSATATLHGISKRKVGRYCNRDKIAYEYFCIYARFGNPVL